MPELYYAMCFDGNDEEKSKFYHCIALAENEEDFKASALKQRDVDFTNILTLTELLKETGLQKEILDLSQRIDDFNPIVFSKPIAFFSDRQADERGADPNQAMDNGIVSVSIDYQDRSDFMKQAKVWLLRQAGYVQEDPRFSNIYTIIDQEAAEQSMLLIDAAQFPPNSIIYQFGERMQSLYDGEKAVQMENQAPYLIGSQDIVDFLSNLREEPELIFRDEELAIDYTTEKAFKGVMLLKTDKSLDEVRKHLRRFTRIKSIDGYDENGTPVNERWVYFRFIEQLLTQEWLRCSEPEVTSYFMKPFDEVLFARLDSCSYHRITKNTDKIIENPKYPNLNGGFLYTKRQQNAHLLGRKKLTIEQTHKALYDNFADVFNLRRKTPEDINNYIDKILDNSQSYTLTTSLELIHMCFIGIYLGVDFLHDPLRAILLKEYNDNMTELAYSQHLENYYINHQRAAENIKDLASVIWRKSNGKIISFNTIFDVFEENKHFLYYAYDRSTLTDFIKYYQNNYDDKALTNVENIQNMLYAMCKGIGYQNDPIGEDT